METTLGLRLLESLSREVLEQLKLVTEIHHPGESGRAREEVLRRYLRRIVPSGFGIDTGFVIDSGGNISRQIDIVIYRPNYHPVIDLGGVKHFMVESVAAVIENKAAIADVERLNNALANVESVKRLDRTGGGLNQRLIGSTKAGQVQRDDFNDQVFAGIVTEESLRSDTALSVVHAYLVDRPRHVWPNVYADVRNFAITYMHEPGPEMTANPYLGERLIATGAGCGDCRPPLVDFTVLLVNFLRVAEYLDFPPTRYFPGASGYHGERELPPTPR